VRRSLFVAMLLLAACASEDAATFDAAATGSSSASATTSVATTGAGGAGGAGGQSAGGAGGADLPPAKPAGLVDYVTGNAEDADVTPAGPGLILMGGGTDVDAAFTWATPLVNGGDMVILRASGADGYNDYLFSELGGFDSVHTLLVDTAALAGDPFVAWTLSHAEGVFIAGGDQAKYLSLWKGSAVEDALMDAWARGAVLGGTSAGTAVLGAFMFAAYNDTVYSDEALADPYNMYMTMERDFLALPPLAKVLTDTHFHERDRMGRLVGFLARVVSDGWASEALGLGVDEATALVVEPSGLGTVLGAGAVYVLRTAGAPSSCEAGKPLDYQGLSLHALHAGDTVTLPDGDTAVPGVLLGASAGALSPADPY
jgi:cyanophycinase